MPKGIPGCFLVITKQDQIMGL